MNGVALFLRLVRQVDLVKIVNKDNAMRISIETQVRNEIPLKVKFTLPNPSHQGAGNIAPFLPPLIEGRREGLGGLAVVIS